MSTLKETNFFVKERPKQAYLDSFGFANAHGSPWLGEASPIYMLRCQLAAPRLAHYQANTKLIVSLRNPIERAYSQYHMLLQLGKLAGDFPAALAAAQAVKSLDDVAFDGATGYPLHPVQTLLRYGNYAEQLECFRQYFPEHQFLLIRHEQLRDGHDATLAQIFRFLAVDQVNIQTRQIHQRHYPGLEYKDWLLLREIYDQEIARLEFLLGWDLSGWRDYPETDWQKRLG